MYSHTYTNSDSHSHRNEDSSSWHPDSNTSTPTTTYSKRKRTDPALPDATTHSKRQKVSRSGYRSTNDDTILVQYHYNSRPKVDISKRGESKIIFMRNFNNWVKSVLIGRHAVRGGTVLDLGCGKGGDLLKWKKAGIARYIGLDIAEVAIKHAKERWRDMKGRKFVVEFNTLDCFSFPLSTKIPRTCEFDVVSMQFSLHYAFENKSRARMALRNITSNLKQGGKFIGTIPDANWIVKRLKALPKDELAFGNEIYNIRFEQKETFPTFGHKYWFWLADAVDCPEYLVHFRTFERLAAEYGLELKYKKRFHDVYNEAKDEQTFRELLYVMKVIRENPDDGEMSEAEWEAAGLYIAFAFEKVR